MGPIKSVRDVVVPVTLRTIRAARIIRKYMAYRPTAMHLAHTGNRTCTIDASASLQQMKIGDIT